MCCKPPMKSREMKKQLQAIGWVEGCEWRQMLILHDQGPEYLFTLYLLSSWGGENKLYRLVQSLPVINSDHEVEEMKRESDFRHLDWSRCGDARVVLSLPVSLCISLEGALSVSHLGLVFLSWKPFLMSASRLSMMQPSSWGTPPLLTAKITHRYRLESNCS